MTHEMRPRKSIEDDAVHATGTRDSEWRAVEGLDLLLEVLLDIREMLIPQIINVEAKKKKR